MEVVAIAIFIFVLLFLFMGIKIVPQSNAYLVERLGRYHRTLNAGFNVIIPIFEYVEHKMDLKEQELGDKDISTITKDNVKIGIKLSVIYKLKEPHKTAYRFTDVKGMLMDPIVSTVRSNVGRSELDQVQSNRSEINDAINEELTPIMNEWGIHLTRVDIVDVNVDEDTTKAMQLQLNAERTRRALVLEAQGKKEAKQLNLNYKLKK